MQRSYTNIVKALLINNTSCCCFQRDFFLIYVTKFCKAFIIKRNAKLRIFNILLKKSRDIKKSMETVCLIYFNKYIL